MNLTEIYRWVLHRLINQNGYVTTNPMDEPQSQPVTLPVFSFPEDKFRHGRILRFFPQSGYGFVKDAQGHDVYFHVDEIRFVGEKRDRTYVNEGAPVGFDVGVTSRGMRVTHLKIY